MMTTSETRLDGMNNPDRNNVYRKPAPLKWFLAIGNEAIVPKIITRPEGMKVNMMLLKKFRYISESIKASI